MKLNLRERLTEEEINELRKRVFGFAHQMFLNGLTTGRELNREIIMNEAEQFIKDKISAMSKYFVDDDIWEVMPPVGYNPDPKVKIADPSRKMNVLMDEAIKKAGDGIHNATNAAMGMDPSHMEEKPEWADKFRPFN